MGGQDEDEALHKQPARLIAGLAGSNEARLRLSLIPLFLEHPEFSTYVRRSLKMLDARGRITLQCYYSAAVCLQKKHFPKAQIKLELPNYFATELMLSSDDPEENLRLLAHRHAELTGTHLNWLGTYHHAEQRWMASRRGGKQ